MSKELFDSYAVNYKIAEMSELMHLYDQFDMAIQNETDADTKTELELAQDEVSATMGYLQNTNLGDYLYSNLTSKSLGYSEGDVQKFLNISEDINKLMSALIEAAVSGMYAEGKH